MAKNRAILTIDGAPKGLCLDDASATPQHDAISFNVDYSQGKHAPRGAFGRVRDDVGLNAQMFLHDFGPTSRYLLSVGRSDGVIKCFMSDVYGKLKFPTESLGALGEPDQDVVLCTFFSTTLAATAQSATNPAVEGVNPRQVTIISTATNSYVFDPLRVPHIQLLNPARVSDGGDAQKGQEASFPYFTTAPRGRIVVQHQGATFYMGLLPGTVFGLSRPVVGVTSNPLVPVIIDQTRTYYTVGPNVFFYSDPSDPAGIPGRNIVQLDATEIITAAHSFKQQLIIFTRTSIYVFSGTNNQNYQLLRVSTGVGCVAQNSVVEVSGLLRFMSRDGVYAWDGSGDPQRVTSDFDALWSGQYQRTPVVWNETFPFNWPFIIDQAQIEYVSGFYNDATRQIWWSLPVQGQLLGLPRRAQSVTLTLDLTTGAWSLWFINAPYDSPMASGLTVPTPFGLRVFTSSPSGFLQQYGATVLDGPVLDGTSKGIYYAWQTGRIPASNDETTNQRRVHLKMTPGCSHITGQSALVMPRVILSSENSWLNPGDNQTSAVVSSHPYGALDGASAAAQENFFWDGGTWSDDVSGTTKWWMADTFTAICDVACPSESFRIMVIDDNLAAVERAPYPVIESMTLEYGPEGGFRH